MYKIALNVFALILIVEKLDSNPYSNMKFTGMPWANHCHSAKPVSDY